jgi:hypothetical protein
MDIYEDLLNLYSNPIIIRRIKATRMSWAGHVACKGEDTKECRALVGKYKGKRPLGRPRRRWEDGIKTDLRETGCEGVEWIYLTQVRDRSRALVNAVMNLRVLVSSSRLVIWTSRCLI